jgi:ABC-type phosphate transport system substrate-binding protein
MKRKNATCLFALAAGLLCMSNEAIDRPVQAQEAEPLVMVANKGNAAAASISKAEAKKMMLGQTLTWASGAPVIIVLTPAGSAERSAVLTKICGMSESDFTRYQLQVAFTGRTAATVHEEHSVAGVTTFVKTHPGAVGFLHKSEAGDDVKAVFALN